MQRFPIVYSAKVTGIESLPNEKFSALYARPAPGEKRSVLRIMSSLRRYFIRRLVASCITLLGVSCIIFLIVRLLPGDPARIIAGLLASEADVALIRTQLGLDQPVHVHMACSWYGPYVGIWGFQPGRRSR